MERRKAVYCCMRKSRVIVEGAIYHVVARANRNEFILNQPGMKEALLDVISRARKRWRFNISNFCLMGNHIHLMITPQHGENLSRIMQWILSVFAIKFNKFLGYKGHVWYDRFRSKIIENFQQFLNTFLYVSENPVKAEIRRCAVDYRYSGICHIRIGDFSIVDPPDAAVQLLIAEHYSPLMIT
jgi:putative transposase